MPKQSFAFLFPGLLRFARNDTEELLGLALNLKLNIDPTLKCYLSI